MNIIIRILTFPFYLVRAVCLTHPIISAIVIVVVYFLAGTPGWSFNHKYSIYLNRSEQLPKGQGGQEIWFYLACLFGLYLLSCCCAGYYKLPPPNWTGSMLSGGKYLINALKSVWESGR